MLGARLRWWRVPLSRTVASISLAFLLAFIAVEAGAQDCASQVHAILRDLGVAYPEFISFHTVEQRTGSDDSERVRALNHWIDHPVCREGSLVIQTSPRCRIRQVYTRGGCSVPGLPSY